MFKILIVEDDRGIAEGIQSLLEQWGMEARQVQDFRNITGEFETYQPHLILGYQAAQLRRLLLVRPAAAEDCGAHHFHLLGG